MSLSKKDVLDTLTKTGINNLEDLIQSRDNMLRSDSFFVHKKFVFNEDKD